MSLVRTEAEAHHVARECRVFTVAEVAILIETLGDGVLGVKHSFPGATVTGIRRKARHGSELLHRRRQTDAA